MKARLVYLLEGQEIELEKMNLDSLDQLTYNAFGSLEDIIESPRYEHLLGDLPKDGKVKVAFDIMDVPLKATDYFAEFGFDLFDKSSQYLSVLVHDRGIRPTIGNMRENIVRTLCDVEVVEEFYELFKERFTPKERFYYSMGMLSENDRLVFDGIKRIINDTTAHSDGYFVGRMFIDGLSRFESVKNKDEKGRLVSPKVYNKK